MQELINQLEDLKTRIQKTWQLLQLDQTKEEISQLEKEMAEPDFWGNQEEAAQKSKRLDELKEELERWEKIQKEVDDTLEIAKLDKADRDVNLRKEIEEKLEELEKKFNDLEFYILFSEKYDKNNAIFAIHAGAGGTEAQDWAQMLERMLLRFSEKKGWQARVMDESRGQEAGIKSVTVEVKGRYAYGHLKSEAGVHRLVRISPFDAEKMRHTSFALVEVLPELEETDEVEIKEEDLKIDTYRAGGHGGQSVNTTDSAVRIRHIPTNIVVTCQNERSQAQNKDFAMKVLKSKLHQKHLEEQAKEKAQLRGEYQSAEWGNQIRSYVLQPYKMVKDHRTKYEETDPDAVLDGKLESFMEAYLRWSKEGKM